MSGPKKLAIATLTVTEVELIDRRLERATCEDRRAFSLTECDTVRIQRAEVYALVGTHRAGQQLTVTITEPDEATR